ncbi:MAG: excinuclease ABC subunit UvrC [Clostridiales bacterium]|nr:excinuclease ABC subunit UvrC [Clostridiales bacterium]
MLRSQTERCIILSTNMDTKLKNLPDQPGVYIMKDNKGRIIYIGKAVSLKNRVRQYFRSTGHTGKVGAMVANVADFEYILTDSEVEALILESNLIKKHRPKYNILFKDDKHYPFIKVTTGEEFPRILMTRRIKKDNNRYFGPYTSAKAVRETIEVIKRLFPVRTCNRKIKEGQKPDRPCLNYYIGQCWGPCLGNIKKQDYQRMIEEVCRFLEGKQEDVLKDLQKQMQEAADNLQFEKAASLRDKIQAIEKILENQKIMSTSMVDQDILAFYQEEDKTSVQIFFVRSGKLISAERYILDDTADEDCKEIINSYLKQFYGNSAFIPKEILIQENVDDREAIEQWLSERKGNRVYIRVPRRGEKFKLVQMALKNAKEYLQTYNSKAEREFARTRGAAMELQQALNLAVFPSRMEAFDISNIQGAQSVASMVVFENGKPAKKEYRRFRIKTVEGQDDFASMAEIIERRFRKGLEERKRLNEEGKDYSQGKFAKFPDLIIIDGGKGQLGAALSSMRKLGVDNIPVFGLAEKNDEIYSRGEKEPIRLPSNSNALHLLQRIRDEAHRFALTYHRSLRTKNSLHSVLLDIPGIGPKRMKQLLKVFGSVSGIRKASVEQLAKVEGMNKKVAEELKQYLG